ncbi:uncharacterized protein LOC100184402 [Ciona intestinalis]
MVVVSDSRNRVGQDAGFFTSLDGILKAVQFVLSLITLILVSSSHYWTIVGAGQMSYVTFVASFCCTTLAISAFIYFCKCYNGYLLNKLPWDKLELFYSLGCALMFFIGMCVSANSADTFKNTRGTFDELFIASSIFCVLTMFAYLVYAFLIFRGRNPRSVPPPPIPDDV